MPTMTIAAAKKVLMSKPMNSSPTGTISNTSNPDEALRDKAVVNESFSLAHLGFFLTGSVSDHSER